MIERDNELKQLLSRWEPPAPRPVLDARVWHSYRTELQRRRRWKIFGAIAAAAVLVVSVSRWPSAAPTVDNADWQPLPNGAITVVKVR